MKFFTYSQNNSGGGFDIDDRRAIAHYVIVEATDTADADRRAVTHGLYFDGVDSGTDCGCCGDRWSRAWSNDGTTSPEVYAESPERAADGDLFTKPGDPVVIVVRASGQRDIFRKYGSREVSA